MHSRLNTARIASLPHRAVAVVLAVVVAVLVVVSASPTLHAWLHGDERRDAAVCSHAHAHPAHGDDSERDEDAGCVITLFAQGQVDWAGAPILVHGPTGMASAAPQAVFDTPCVRRTWREPPSCGPPQA